MAFIGKIRALGLVLCVKITYIFLGARCEERLLNRLQEYNLTCIRVNNPVASSTEEFAIEPVECMGVCDRACVMWLRLRPYYLLILD